MKFLPLGLLLFLVSLAHAQTEMQNWITTLDATWQQTYAKEVTAPFDAEMAKLAQQYLAAIEASATRTSASGDLDQTVALRAERERFALAKDVPGEDEPTTPAALKQLRTSWRTQAARLEKDRATRGKAVLARYDAVLAQAQKQLTQNQRIDDALLLKKQREDVAARWGSAAPAAPVVAPVEPAKAAAPPAVAKATPSATTQQAKGPKLPPREVLEKLLAAGVDVTIGEYRTEKRIRSVSEAPERFAFFHLAFRAQKDGTDDDLALLDHVPYLVNLTLDKVDVTDAGLQHLRGVNGLKHFDLTNLPKVTEAGFRLIADLPLVDYIKLWDMPSPEVAIKGVAGGKHVGAVMIGQMAISDSALATLSTSPSITDVNFEKGATGLTPAGVAQLAKMKKLRKINFIDFAVDDAMAAELGKMEGLQDVRTKTSAMTEAGVLSLCKLRNLTDLAIPVPPVTPATLAGFKKLRALKNFFVTKGMPANERAALSAALKGVNVRD